jgi:hypothetical protein
MFDVDPHRLFMGYEDIMPEAISISISIYIHKYRWRDPYSFTILEKLCTTWHDLGWTKRLVEMPESSVGPRCSREPDHYALSSTVTTSLINCNDDDQDEV